MEPGQHRETARVLLVNQNHEVFLLLTHFDPEVGLPPRWITPGGGIDQGETAKQAAVRELAEETGLIVTEAELGEQIWQISGSWLWGDGINHHSFVDYFYRLDIDDFELDDSGWTPEEHRDVLEYRWWKISDLIESEQNVGPVGLVDHLKHHLP